MFTEDNSQEIRMPERERLDTIISHGSSTPRYAGPDDDTQVIDPDTKILREIIDLIGKADAELLRRCLDKEEKVKVKEDEKWIRLQREAIKNYLRAVEREDLYEAFEKGNTYEK